jgi:hypothetical protein
MSQFNYPELTVVARYAVPEDRTRFEHTIELAGGALRSVAQAQETVQWVKSLREEADADMVYRRHCHMIVRYELLATQYVSTVPQ